MHHLRRLFSIITCRIAEELIQVAVRDFPDKAVNQNDETFPLSEPLRIGFVRLQMTALQLKYAVANSMIYLMGILAPEDLLQLFDWAGAHAERRASPTAAREAGGAQTRYLNCPKLPSGKRRRRLGAGALLGQLSALKGIGMQTK